MEQFREKLKALREKRGWSQEDLARAIDVSLSTVQRWESKDTKPIRLARRALNRLFKKASIDKPKVVAAVPCFNTERYIEDVVTRARKYVDLVIVIDDGSSDGTADVARAAGALVISHSKNGGYGKAIKSCFEAARTNGADVLVILDGDGQHNPDEIPRL